MRMLNILEVGGWKVFSSWRYFEEAKYVGGKRLEGIFFMDVF